MGEIESNINDRAHEASLQLEKLAKEILYLARNADEETSMRLENAIDSVARAGLAIRTSQYVEYGND